ncbi:hypothetical protein EVAR_47032_1 [Eumeta japonica]|uniref:Uncharacterized protein n=1 Tax=Eumeta variegata TaxID=151549 RepID=A0A4C1XK60_EUMVA|nr:hypothetical protein EVAR_47032_1 [Eumeta japonica]
MLSRQFLVLSAECATWCRGVAVAQGDTHQSYIHIETHPKLPFAESSDSVHASSPPPAPADVGTRQIRERNGNAHSCLLKQFARSSSLVPISYAITRGADCVVKRRPVMFQRTTLPLLI